MRPGRQDPSTTGPKIVAHDERLSWKICPGANEVECFMRKILPLSEIRALVGTDIGQSEWLQIDQGRIDRFADCTDDHQWIHTDPARAAGGPFGKTIAHGFLTISLIPYLARSASIQPEHTVMAINYGINMVRLIHPVTVGAKIKDTLTLLAVEDKDPRQVMLTTRHNIEIQGETKPACVADMLSLFITAPPL